MHDEHLDVVPLDCAREALGLGQVAVALHGKESGREARLEGGQALVSGQVIFALWAEGKGQARGRGRGRMGRGMWHRGRTAAQPETGGKQQAMAVSMTPPLTHPSPPARPAGCPQVLQPVSHNHRGAAARVRAENPAASAARCPLVSRRQTCTASRRQAAPGRAHQAALGSLPSAAKQQNNTRSHLNGLAQAAPEAVLLCEAGGEEAQDAALPAAHQLAGAAGNERQQSQVVRWPSGAEKRLAGRRRQRSASIN